MLEINSSKRGIRDKSIHIAVAGDEGDSLPLSFLSLFRLVLIPFFFWLGFPVSRHNYKIKSKREFGCVFIKKRETKTTTLPCS